jgi:hypothetical protein
LNVFYDDQEFSENILVTETPQFYALSFTPKDNTQRLWITLQPFKNLDIDNPVDIYYDGVILVEGEFPLDKAPQFTEDGSSGTWNGTQFMNLVRNPSAEISWFYLRPWVDSLGSQIFSDYQGQEGISLIVYTLVDWPSSGWFYLMEMENLFRTFWAKFAWGHVSLIGDKPYRLLLIITSISGVGMAVAFWQRRKRLTELSWDVYFLLGVALVLIWGMALARGISYIFSGWGGFVVARYTYPVIIPSVLILSVGWLVLLEFVENKLMLASWIKHMVYFFGLLALNIISWISISTFYH